MICQSTSAVFPGVSVPQAFSGTVVEKDPMPTTIPHLTIAPPALPTILERKQEEVSSDTPVPQQAPKRVSKFKATRLQQKWRLIRFPYFTIRFESFCFLSSTELNNLQTILSLITFMSFTFNQTGFLPFSMTVRKSTVTTSIIKQPCFSSSKLWRVLTVLHIYLYCTWDWTVVHLSAEPVCLQRVCCCQFR